MLKTIKIILLSWILLFQQHTYAEEIASPILIQHAKKGIVSISDKLISALYSTNNAKEIFGSGFIINKDLGLIITNEHLASKQRVSDLRVTFFNGREVPAKILYTDPWWDIAFLKVAAEDMPPESVALELSVEELHNEQSVIIIGNNQGNSYSIQTGIISNLYDSFGFFPCQTLTVSLNTRGGSSGSPLLNNKGKVIALNFAGDETYASAIPAFYIKDLLDHIIKNQVPPRLETGALVSYYSLDRAAQFSNFPVNLINNYIKKYPDALNNALQVKMIFEDSPAYGVLKPGDIIWRVNSTEVGPNLYKFQRALNYALGDRVKIDVYRNGKLETLSVNLYNLQQQHRKRAIIFGGAVFVEVDDYLRLITGAKKGDVFITNIAQGASFDIFPWMSINDSGGAYFIHVLSIDNIAINSLDDLVKQIPELAKKKNFKVNYKNFGFSYGFNNTPFLSRGELEAEIQYNSLESEPTLVQFDDKKLNWDSEKIPLK